MVAVLSDPKPPAQHPPSSDPGLDPTAPPPIYPQNNVTFPQNNASHPQNNASHPQNNASYPQNNVSYQQNNDGYLQKNTSGPLPISLCLSQSAEPINSPVNTGQMWTTSCQLHPVMCQDSSLALEVASLLPKACPLTWLQQSKSNASTASSSAPLITSCNPSTKKLVVRSDVAFLNRLRALATRGAVVVFYMLTSLMLAAGSALLAVGAVALVDERQVMAGQVGGCCGALPPFTTLPLLRSLATMLLVAGGIIVLLGLLGCCGLLLKNKVMMGTFGFLMALIVVSQLNFTAVAFFNKDALRCRLKQTLVSALRDNYEGTPNSTNAFSQAVDLVQLSLGCCGVESAWDFHSTPWYKRRIPGNLTVPWTCCQSHREAARGTQSSLQLVKKDCPYLSPGPDNPHTASPCFQLLESKMRQHSMLWMLLLVGVTVLEMAAMGSAFMAASSVRGKRHCKHHKKSPSSAGLKR